MNAAKPIRTRLALLASLSVLAAAPAMAENLVFTSWGGSTQQAQQKNWAQPFSAASGIAVAMDGPTDYGKFKAMVESGNVTWDVVDVEGDFAYRAARDGLLEPLDQSKLKGIDPRFISANAVGSFYYSFVLGYNKQSVKGSAPASWSDLFDLKRYPGKRTLYKWSAPGVLELALLADGVPANKLYPLDIDRAFKKLDTIKSQIVWWTGGAQSQQLLASGEASIGMFWNGRINALQHSGAPVGMSWKQNLTAADMLVIPKGSKNKAAAMQFLAYATSAEAQAKFATETGYAPVNLQSKTKMTPAAVKTLPDQFTASQINLDMRYWAEHRDEIAKRWYAWQTQ
ncbi:ABC transporter substrate-binding protein [Aquitalea sp. LB_tupeE]|uniref:ABC transporter substrate-binding protein n=1 Tax=Aquitalea sp. LB_tupeE TaxID=2748078 RepID=UPI0015BE1F66|nr:ABC transporter substrate-binding protein [Aquitalea sp. LB_tupeE]NWK79737.1 ABC transporter substrate-binding protein [Aquitalea sp. LB_tupeE]